MTEPQIARHVWDGSEPSGVVQFTAMADGTAQEYALLDQHERAYAAGLPERILDALGRLSGSLGGYQITRLEHSLQSASRARHSGANVEWVVAALVHDIGDELAPYNHSELAASILQPYVAPEIHWVVLHHGIFQSYYYAHFHGGDRHARDRYKDHPWAASCERFCAEWDQASFDPKYPTDPLDSFRADVHEVFGRQAWSPEVVGPAGERRT